MITLWRYRHLWLFWAVCLVLAAWAWSHGWTVGG